MFNEKDFCIQGVSVEFCSQIKKKKIVGKFRVVFLLTLLCWFLIQ